jgi:membrane fusion protein (multidrug efflux system)
MDGSQFVGPLEPGIITAGRRRRSWSLRQMLAVGGVVLAVAGAGLYGQYYWNTGRFLVSTDDATIQADSVVIGPKIAGIVAAVLVEDNQTVRAGQPLVRIDDRDDRTALDQARASLAADEASVDNLRQQIAQQRMAVEQARAAVAADQAALTFSQQQSARYASLARSGSGTVQDAQRWQADIQEKQAVVLRDSAAVGVAAKQIDVLTAALAKEQATVEQQQASVHQAELNLSYTVIAAPVDGTVGNRTVRAGQYVQAGTQLLAVVPLNAVYITANYKETQLTGVQPGQPVSIDVDMFPGATVRGVVNSIAPASGEEFALLPPDNATGNFTKIVQRIPVKIAIDPHDPLAGRLRPGMSVEPVIDTKPREG